MASPPAAGDARLLALADALNKNFKEQHPSQGDIHKDTEKFARVTGTTVRFFFYFSTLLSIDLPLDLVLLHVSPRASRLSREIRPFVLF